MSAGAGGGAARSTTMAKDYASFRRLLLDLLPQLNPDWIERNPSDLGIALIELLAYTGDQLSYFQDAVANEAYLETAAPAHLRRGVTRGWSTTGCTTAGTRGRGCTLNVDGDTPLPIRARRSIAGCSRRCAAAPIRRRSGDR